MIRSAFTGRRDISGANAASSLAPLVMQVINNCSKGVAVKRQ